MTKNPGRVRNISTSERPNSTDRLLSRLAEPGGLTGNNGQHDVRGVLFHVMNSLPGGLQPVVLAERRARIRITIEAGEITAGYLDPYPVARFEKMAGCPEVDNECIDPTRLNHRRFGPGGPKAGANNAVLEVVGVAVGTNVDQFGGKVGIDRAAGGE